MLELQLRLMPLQWLPRVWPLCAQLRTALVCRVVSVLAVPICVQAKYIIVRNNGSLMAGNETRPYPGPGAIITLTAQPNDLELPLYGSKVRSNCHAPLQFVQHDPL